MRLAALFFCVLLVAAVASAQSVDTQSQLSTIVSKDGTRIAVECTGKGPNLFLPPGRDKADAEFAPAQPVGH